MDCSSVSRPWPNLTLSSPTSCCLRKIYYSHLPSRHSPLSSQIYHVSLEICVRMRLTFTFYLSSGLRLVVLRLLCLSSLLRTPRRRSRPLSKSAVDGRRRLIAEERGSNCARQRLLIRDSKSPRSVERNFCSGSSAELWRQELDPERRTHLAKCDPSTRVYRQMAPGFNTQQLERAQSNKK